MRMVSIYSFALTGRGAGGRHQCPARLTSKRTLANITFLVLLASEQRSHRVCRGFDCVR